MNINVKEKFLKTQKCCRRGTLLVICTCIRLKEERKDEGGGGLVLQINQNLSEDIM